MGALKLTYQSYKPSLYLEQERNTCLRVVTNYEPTLKKCKNYYPPSIKQLGSLIPNK